MDGFANGTEHLLAELLRLDLMLQRQVARLRAADLITEDEFRGLYIPDGQVDALLDQPHRSLQASYDAAGHPGDDLIEEVRQENAARLEAGLRSGSGLPLPRLAELFGLSPLETDILLVCVAPEVDLRYETLYAYVQNDVTKKRPSVDLALKLLCPTLEERLEARAVLSPAAPLLRHEMIRLFDDPQDREPPLLARLLKADQRIVDFLLEQDRIDSQLLPFTRRVEPARALSDLALPDGLVGQLANAVPFLEQGGVAYFHGPYGVGKQAAAEAICAATGRPLLAADMAALLPSGLPLERAVALLAREARLRGTGLYLAHFEALLADARASQHLPALARRLMEAGITLLVGSEQLGHPATVWRDARLLVFEFDLPKFPLRRSMWERALGNDGARPDASVDIAALANKFVLSGGQIEDAARYAESLTHARPESHRQISMGDLYAAARAQSSHDLQQLAQKVEPLYKWADIVLPRRAMQQLREVFSSVKYRHVVYSEWGFERKLSLGKGVNALFCGPSGTGKTMAAQILAHELSLDLYKIDLSGVVSKYIGETEKNLGRIFREAQHSNAILFFDEADALFGKRSEVKDAHDRYANIEVAYLLQKMEEYDGITILATNLRKNMDEAFTRRLHHIVEFPFPDEQQRLLIWRGVFPTESPLAEDVELQFLARQFELAGGNIRNIALSAAFLAAEQDGAIRMDHLLLGAARELRKMGKLPSEAQFRGFYELIRERG
jgi:hypothetical protein